MVVGKPIFTVEQIQGRVRELAEVISNDYEGKNLLAVGILRGAFMFLSDLVRAIQVPLTVDFVVAGSYMKESTTGEVKVYYDVREDVKERDVLLVEDIVDTGITLNHIRERMLLKRPRSLKICTLLDKKEKRLVDIPLDYVGFQIPNEFVVGYGLDYDNRYRNLPYIAAFRKTI
ncbi:MAG: hypoxanthine phosphoribosyltransferase [Nitrospirae bacterium]|nr:hypoxanthine phosphoribosyltransferase [Nitrospirota bacterium]